MVVINKKWAGIALAWGLMFLGNTWRSNGIPTIAIGNNEAQFAGETGCIIAGTATYAKIPGPAEFECQSFDNASLKTDVFTVENGVYTLTDTFTYNVKTKQVVDTPAN